MAYANNQDIRIHYQVEGDGPPLVLQHGLFWSMEGWSRFGYVDALKPHYRLIMIDARGHGASDKPHDGTAYTLPQHVGDIIAVLDALDIPTAHFWGYSMGGWFGFGMVKYALERVGALIIGGAHPYERRLPIDSRTDGSDPDAFVGAFLERMGLDRAALSTEQEAEFYDNDFRALAASLSDRPDLANILSSMTMPSLLYAGEKDGGFPQVQECVQSIPNGGLVSFPGLNHPETFYRSDVVLPHALKFLHAASQS